MGVRVYVFIFFVLSIIGVCYHELWLDEAHHFLLARDSNSFYELIHACRNEGHPLLWNSILYFVTRFSPNVFYMQLVHVLISCLTVVVISKSNLSVGEKVMIIFGYFIFYEYTIISRNYGLSALLIFLLIQAYSKNKEALLKLSLLIFLLANTHLYALLFFVAFVFTYIVCNRSTVFSIKPGAILTAALIVLAGWLLSVYFIMPPIAYAKKFMSYSSYGYLSTERIVNTVTVCLKGLFYLPDYTAPNHHFENSHYFLTLNLKLWVLYLLSGIAIGIPILILRAHVFALTLFCSFLLIFSMVYFFLPLTYGARYFGFFYLVFLACYWLARRQVSRGWVRLSFVIFALQFINGMYAYSMDICYPFSESKNMNDYLKQVRIGKENVFILDRTLRPGISAYSNEKYFGVENGALLSYCLWDTTLSDSMLKVKLDLALNKDSSCLVVADKPVGNLLDTARLVKLKVFDNSILKGENAVVYRYQRKAGDK